LLSRSLLIHWIRCCCFFFEFFFIYTFNVKRKLCHSFSSLYIHEKLPYVMIKSDSTPCFFFSQVYIENKT
jgi:hypothetical protein